MVWQDTVTWEGKNLGRVRFGVQQGWAGNQCRGGKRFGNRVGEAPSHDQLAVLFLCISEFRRVGDNWIWEFTWGEALLGCLLRDHGVSPNFVEDNILWNFPPMGWTLVPSWDTLLRKNLLGNHIL